MTRDRVDIYEADGVTIYVSDVEIRKIGDDADETNSARLELSRTGEAWIGGGAQPMFLLKLAEKED